MTIPGVGYTARGRDTEGNIFRILETDESAHSRGIHKGAFMGLQPTGKPITMTGIEIFHIENGKIAELWGEANLFGLMQQLGIFPG